MMNVAASIIIIVGITACVLAQDTPPCPTWYNYDPSTKKCQCNFDLDGGLICIEPGLVYLRIDYCMTFDEGSNMSVVGECHRGSYNHHQILRGLYSLMPNDSSQLTNSQCESNKRKGLLCAKCDEGYGVSVTSLTPKCIKCTYSTFSAILMYLMIELIPITAFFIAIVIFRINICTGPLFGYFIYCQSYAAISNQLFEVHHYILDNASPFFKCLLYISYGMSSLWALCSFNILPPLCISTKINFMDAFLMKYIRVVYPLFLVPATYFLIELHARNFKPIVYLWKPFSFCISKLSRTVTTNDSIIHAYATLFLLSAGVLNYISFKLLNLTDLIRQDSIVFHQRLLTDPTVTAYTTHHAPYIASSFVMLIVFGFLPAIVLALYPIGRFRNALEYFMGQRRRIMLNIFCDTVHSCYKDGLNGTRDFRSSLGILLLLTPSLILLNAHLTGHFALGTYLIAASILFIGSLLVAYIRPCNTYLANLSLSFHTGLSSLVCVQLVLWMQNDTHVAINTNGMVITFALLNFLPHLLISLWLGYKLFKTETFRRVMRREFLLCGYYRISQHLTTMTGYNNID